MKLCKIGIHYNIFSKDSEENLHRMAKISKDLEEAFEKHYDGPKNDTYMEFDECKHCGRIKIKINGYKKQ